MDVSTVIWCTGFRPDLGWIDLPVLGDAGQPVHQRGVVDAEPGLYFVGQPFQYALTSSLVGGVGRDAEHIAKHIASTGVGRDSGTAVADLSTVNASGGDQHFRACVRRHPTDRPRGEGRRRR